MSLTIEEAKRIALEPIGSNPTTALDNAERVLREARLATGNWEEDPDNNTPYLQLADHKARLQRIIGWTEAKDDNPLSVIEAINRLAKHLDL